MTVYIDTERFAKITHLDSGSHDSSEEGMCAMEVAAWIVGEPHTDHPQCVCPVIGAFMRAWNDGLPEAERTEILLPLIPKTINTKGSAALETRRSLMAADWLVRIHTPAWLRLAGLTDQAALLEVLPEITVMAQVPSIRAPLEAVRRDAAAAWDAARTAARDAARDADCDAAGDAAWDAGWAAAGDAARNAAWTAARGAAGDAAWDAAGDAAGDAAWDAGWAAARGAAGDAAWDAAWVKLKPTKVLLQASALKLVEQMIDARESE